MAKKRSETDQPHEARDNKIVRANVNRHLSKGPEFVSLYANDLQVQTSPWDIKVTLGQIGDITTSEQGEPRVVVNLIAELCLSPQIAKRLALILIGQIQNYEENFGPIPQPPPD